VGLNRLHRRVLHRHPEQDRRHRPGRGRRRGGALAPGGYGEDQILRKHLDVGGDYAFRLRGEDHVWTPETIAKLQHATRANDAKTYAEYSRSSTSRTSAC
jgi:glutamate synthase domain-containing protein 2